MSTSEGGGAGGADGTSTRARPGRIRRLLAPVLSALLATAVAVPGTWYAAGRAGQAEVLPPPSFASAEELRQHLLGTAINGSDATLQGVPPGRYRLQATCVPPLEPAWPVRVMAVHDDDEVLVIDMPCDGDFHAADPPLHLTDYRAYFFSWHPFVEADPTIEGGPFPFEGLSEVVVVVSLVPTD